MTIYYSLTFLLLAAEMLTFCALVSPLPFAVRKRVFGFLENSPIVAKIAYGVKISFIFVAILFADALQRMFRVTAEVDLAKAGKGVPDARAESSLHARRFYAQRNVYLTGFCLFLSLVLTRTFYILLELIDMQEKHAQLQKRETTAGSDLQKELVQMRERLAEYEEKQRDYEILKKQAAQNAKEYDRLATEYNKITGNVSDKRND